MLSVILSDSHSSDTDRSGKAFKRRTSLVSSTYVITIIQILTEYSHAYVQGASVHMHTNAGVWAKSLLDEY